MVAGGQRLADVRVLIAEDDDDLRESLSELLSVWGAIVTTAASGDEAFDVFTQERPEVVISDIWMPRGDGLSLVQRIRALSPEDGGLTPVIAMSAAVSEAESLQAGFHFHLQKPIDPAVLFSTIADFVHGSDVKRSTSCWSWEAYSRTKRRPRSSSA
jgi:CheY-like chemotaxis protein